MAKSSLSNCPQSIPLSNKDSHPVLRELFPGEELDADIVLLLHELDKNAEAARQLLNEAIVEGLKLIHANSYWHIEEAEKVMAWVYHRYPEVSTSVIASDLDGIAFNMSLDEHIAARDRIERENLQRQQEARRKHLRSMPYDEYLRTDHWQNKRASALEDAGYRCQICYSERNLHVHHRTYKRRGHELPEDLTVLCSECHQHFHDKLKVQS